MKLKKICLALAIAFAILAPSFCVAEPLGPQWHIEQFVDEMDDKTYFIVQNTSKEAVRNNGIEAFPRLAFIGKTGGVFSCSVFPEMWMGSKDNVSIQYRLDKEKAKTSGGWISSKKSIFLVKPEQFAKKLYGHKQLLIRLSGYSGTVRTVKFDITGIEQALKEFSKAAGWK